jgi:hypothetical protein
VETTRSAGNLVDSGAATGAAPTPGKDSQNWIARAVLAIREVAKARDELTVDDIWPQLGEDTPPDPKSMGAALKRASMTLKIIEDTGRWARSTRRSGRRVVVWRSCIRTA